TSRSALSQSTKLQATAQQRNSGENLCELSDTLSTDTLNTSKNNDLPCAIRVERLCITGV
ncbi:MAG: hypothetical protein V4734_13885, partial [Terriglobus sp.]